MDGPERGERWVPGQARDDTWWLRRDRNQTRTQFRGLKFRASHCDKMIAGRITPNVARMLTLVAIQPRAAGDTSMITCSARVSDATFCDDGRSPRRAAAEVVSGYDAQTPMPISMNPASAT